MADTKKQSAFSIRRSEQDDKNRAKFINELLSKRPKSNWREVLAARPGGGTRVVVGR